MNGRCHYRAQCIVGAQIKFDHWLGIQLYPKGTGSLWLAQTSQDIFPWLTNPFHLSLIPSPEKIRLLVWEGPLPPMAMWRPPEVPVSTIQTMHLQGPCKQEAAGRLQNNVTAYCAVHLCTEWPRYLHSRVWPGKVLRYSASTHAIISARHAET